MASFQEQLAQRLAQIAGGSESATTWEKLKRQRDAQRRASLEAISQINAQTDAYRQQLANYANIYGSGRVVPGKVQQPLVPKKSTKKKTTTNSGSLGDSWASIGDAFRSVFQ